MEPSAGIRGRCSTFADFITPNSRRGMRVPGGKGSGVGSRLLRYRTRIMTPSYLMQRENWEEVWQD